MSGRLFGALLAVLATVLGSTEVAALVNEEPHVWNARYNGTGNAYDAARDLVVSPDGARVFVTGSSAGTDGSSDYATVAHAASTGTTEWTARYAGSANASDRPFAIATSSDGSFVVVTGESKRSYATVAYSGATGAQLWVAQHAGPGFAADVVVSPDSSLVFVTGVSNGTVAYSSATGAEVWVARYGVTGFHSAYAIAASNDGAHVYVTGISGHDYATVAYDARTGAQEWASRYPAGTSSYGAIAVSVTPDDSKVLVTGQSEGAYGTVAYSAATGAQLWEARYEGISGGSEGASALSVSPDGSTAFVTGSATSRRTLVPPQVPHASTSALATVAYDTASGATKWVTRYRSDIDDLVATALATSPDGARVYVAAAAYASPLFTCAVVACPTSAYAFAISDYITLGYDAADGTVEWQQRMNGPGRSADLALGLGVSPDGSRIFVTGGSADVGDVSGSASDYATIAYNASTCASGANEVGDISWDIHGTVEPQLGPGASYAHWADCHVVVPNEL